MLFKDYFKHSSPSEDQRPQCFVWRRGESCYCPRQSRCLWGLKAKTNIIFLFIVTTEKNICYRLIAQFMPFWKQYCCSFTVTFELWKQLIKKNIGFCAGSVIATKPQKKTKRQNYYKLLGGNNLYSHFLKNKRHPKKYHTGKCPTWRYFTPYWVQIKSNFTTRSGHAAKIPDTQLTPQQSGSEGNELFWHEKPPEVTASVMTACTQPPTTAHPPF